MKATEAREITTTHSGIEAKSAKRLYERAQIAIRSAAEDGKTSCAVFLDWQTEAGTTAVLDMLRKDGFQAELKPALGLAFVNAAIPASIAISWKA